MSTTLVTGSNRGIGFELAKQLKARGDTVIAVCRKPSAELTALGVRVEAGVDVSVQQDVAGLAKRLHGVTLSLLIHNAGVLAGESLEDLDLDSIRRQFEVNALAPLHLTSLLLQNLERGAKIGFVSSRMGSIADNGSGGSYGYRMSKAALNIAAVSVARDLAERGIAVAVLHPGYVRTDMTGGSGNVEPADAARGLLARLEALTLETSGSFWHANGEELPW